MKKRQNGEKIPFQNKREFKKLTVVIAILKIKKKFRKDANQQ